ncbi:MAG: YraN family protein [Dermatophilaceae bacterium]
MPTPADRVNSDRAEADRAVVTRSGVRYDRATLGRYGERLAERYLQDIGLQVVDRNWQCEHGEIDIVALDAGCLVVCEVKARSSTGYGSPVEAVTVAKVLRLRRLAAAWLASHEVHRDQVRIDVVGVLCQPGCRPVLRHVVGVGS